jgi:molybdopterin-guanine dinucleotide biosynthesis protein A
LSAARIPGVLLTGGRSARMGRDKATIVVRGETLAARAARVLRAVCAPCVEAGDGGSGLPAVREEPPGSGPLAAFLAGVDALGATGPVFLLAVDLPHVDERAVRLLASRPGTHSVVPVVAGRHQYACARWSAAAIARARASGSAALGALMGDDVELLDEAAWRGVLAPGVFRDVDTPGDLASLGP